MTYDPYARECSGDTESTTEQVYLRHIRMELQNVTAAIDDLTAAIRSFRPAPPPPSVVGETFLDDEDIEPDVDDEPPPDYGPPGSGAVITEYD